MKWIAFALFVFIGAASAQDAKLSEKQITAWSAGQEELTGCVAFWHFANTTRRHTRSITVNAWLVS